MLGSHQNDRRDPAEEVVLVQLPVNSGVSYLYVESASTSIRSTLFLFLHSITILMMAYLVMSASDEEVQED